MIYLHAQNDVLGVSVCLIHIFWVKCPFTLYILKKCLKITVVVKYVTFLLSSVLYFYNNTLTIIFLTLINFSIKI